MTTSAAPRNYYALGSLIAVGALAAYMVQILGLKWLTVPWYLPVLGTLGAILAVAGLAQRLSVVRCGVVGLLAILAFGEWALLLKLTVLPEYAGPQAGQTFPTFAAKFADGTPFSDANLKGDKETILVFFRGRW